MEEDESRKEPKESKGVPVQESKKRSKKITSYFGIKVNGESSLNEWLKAVRNLSPKKEPSQRAEVPVN